MTTDTRGEMRWHQQHFFLVLCLSAAQQVVQNRAVGVSGLAAQAGVPRSGSRILDAFD